MGGTRGLYTVLHYVPVIIPIFFVFSPPPHSFFRRINPRVPLSVSAISPLREAARVCVCVNCVLCSFYITGPCVNFQGHSVLPPRRSSIMRTVLSPKQYGTEKKKLKCNIPTEKKIKIKRDRIFIVGRMRVKNLWFRRNLISLYEFRGKCACFFFFLYH